MTVSRLIGLPLAVLMLHLGFVANDAKCRLETPASHQHHGTRPHARSESAQHRTHAPAVPVCCQALGSCSATIGLTRLALVLVGLPSGPTQILTTPPARASLSIAPEAPPPRA